MRAERGQSSASSSEPRWVAQEGRQEGWKGARRRRSRWFVAVLAGLLGVAGCGLRADETIGGETHFLRTCELPSDTCGPFDCLGRVCSWSCDRDADCASLPGARCMPEQGTLLEDAEAPRRCDVPCVHEDDCQVVSAAHRCEAGMCRAGVPASVTPSSTASPELETDLDPEPEPEPPAASGGGAPELCAGGRVSLERRVVLGDSFFATTVPFADALEGRERYDDRARLALNALALGGRGIEDQYAGARAERPVDLIVMTGGGADVLLGSCPTSDPPPEDGSPAVDASCPIIAEAVAAARDLLTRFGQEGVTRVLYVFYPDPLVPAVRERVDVLRPLVEEVCAASALCHFIDLRPVFEGRYDVYIQEDGLNPTEVGSRAVAEAVGEALDELCIVR